MLQALLPCDASVGLGSAPCFRRYCHVDASVGLGSAPCFRRYCPPPPPLLPGCWVAASLALPPPWAYAATGSTTHGTWGQHTWLHAGQQSQCPSLTALALWQQVGARRMWQGPLQTYTSRSRGAEERGGEGAGWGGGAALATQSTTAAPLTASQQLLTPFANWQVLPALAL